jgi:hypothetical protein
MKITASMIRDAADEVGGEVREDYSGRGMYGATCMGIVVEAWAAQGIIQSIAAAVASEEGWDSLYDEGEDLQADYEEEVEARMSSDSMGLRAIYYFRGVHA